MATEREMGDNSNFQGTAGGGEVTSLFTPTPEDVWKSIERLPPESRKQLIERLNPVGEAGPPLDEDTANQAEDILNQRMGGRASNPKGKQKVDVRVREPPSKRRRYEAEDSDDDEEEEDDLDFALLDQEGWEKEINTDELNKKAPLSNEPVKISTKFEDMSAETIAAFVKILSWVNTLSLTEDAKMRTLVMILTHRDLAKFIAQSYSKRRSIANTIEDVKTM